jgi:hypothetical protein
VSTGLAFAFLEPHCVRRTSPLASITAVLRCSRCLSDRHCRHARLGRVEPPRCKPRPPTGARRPRQALAQPTAAGDLP